MFDDNTRTDDDKPTNSVVDLENARRLRQGREELNREAAGIKAARGRKGKTRATYEDYIELLKQVFPGEHRRDLLSGRLIVKHSGRWHPITRGSTAWDVFTSHVQDREDHDPAYKPEHIGAYLRKYEDTLKPELLLDLSAKWDGKERIKWFCSRLNAKYLSSTAVYEIIRKVMVDTLRKATDPTSVQNVVLILQGAQGIGKDETVKMLTSVFEPEQWDPYRPSRVTYTANITLRPAMPEAEWGRFLCQNLVCVISEFDRIKDAASQATWKDITTKSTADWREMRQEAVTQHVVRASLIATINPPDMNDDSTGCRRLAPIELAGPPFNKALPTERPAIAWNKTKGLEEGEPAAMADIFTDKAQVLAELVHYIANPGLCELSAATQTELENVRDRMTPEDDTSRAVDTFISTANSTEEIKLFNETQEIQFEGATVKAKLVPPDFSTRIIRQVVKEYGVNEQNLRARLNTLGLRRKRSSYGGAVWYLIPTPTPPPSCECGEPILIGDKYKVCPVCQIPYAYTWQRLKGEEEARRLQGEFE